MKLKRRNILKPNNIYHGDCLELMKRIPDNSIDMILADIPYNEVNRLSNGLRNLNKMKADELTFNLGDTLKECIRICSGSIYIWCGTEQVSFIRSFFVRKGLSTRLGIWEKSNPSVMNGQYIWLSNIECCIYAKNNGATFNEHCKGTVWKYPTTRGKLHPTMKPIGLMRMLILVSSNEGDTILDFTMGSGTTCVAAKQTGRRYIGIELDKEYFEIAKKRIAQTNVSIKGFLK